MHYLEIYIKITLFMSPVVQSSSPVQWSSPANRYTLLLTKTVRGNARSLGKVDGNKLLSVVLEGLKNSPQIKMPFLKRGAFLTSILENKDSIDTLRRLCACLGSAM